MKFLSTELFEKLGAESKASPRLRKNYNLHQLEDSVQRFLNVIQPGSYVTPHKHQGLDAFECYCLLNGSVGLIIFKDNGEIESTHKLSATGDFRGVEIPGNTYHTIVCLEPNTVLFEVKEGPYDPHGMKYVLPGFPNELTYLQEGPQSEAGRKVTEVVSHWQKLFSK